MLTHIYVFIHNDNRTQSKSCNNSAHTTVQWNTWSRKDMYTIIIFIITVTVGTNFSSVKLLFYPGKNVSFPTRKNPIISPPSVHPSIQQSDTPFHFWRYRRDFWDRVASIGSCFWMNQLLFSEMNHLFFFLCTSFSFCLVRWRIDSWTVEVNRIFCHCWFPLSLGVSPLTNKISKRQTDEWYQFSFIWVVTQVSSAIGFEMATVLHIATSFFFQLVTNCVLALLLFIISELELCATTHFEEH